MIPLHTGSNFSFLQGVLTPQRLAEELKLKGYSAGALTDSSGMHGSVKFQKECDELGLRGVTGTKIYTNSKRTEYLLLLPVNDDGFAEMNRILTSCSLYDDYDVIQAASGTKSCFILSPFVSILKALAGHPGLYAELNSAKSDKLRNREVYNFCTANNIKYAATPVVYFSSAEDYMLHKIEAAIRLRKTIDTLPTEELLPEDYIAAEKTEEERKWKSLPEALKNNEFIASRIEFQFRLGKYKFPAFPLPAGETAYSWLWKLASSGLEQRYPKLEKKVIDRLKYELDVIEELNFCDYFLVVWDIIREAKQRGMVHIGRGSAANSLVSYCLGFTEVDPIQYDLYFERFLNKGRRSPPDVDLDFSWKERDELVRYIFNKYGYERTAMISTTITFRARSAFRETAKAFGIPDKEISKFSKFIPWTSAANLPNLKGMFPETKNLPFDKEPWKDILKYASLLSGYPRHLSIHPGGLVIAPTHITDYTALSYAKNKGLGLIVTQPDMYSIEDIGLVKIDLLSQRSLGVLRDTLTELQKKQ